MTYTSMQAAAARTSSWDTEAGTSASSSDGEGASAPSDLVTFGKAGGAIVLLLGAIMAACATVMYGPSAGQSSSTSAMQVQPSRGLPDEAVLIPANSKPALGLLSFGGPAVTHRAGKNLSIEGTLRDADPPAAQPLEVQPEQLSDSDKVATVPAAESTPWPWHYTYALPCWYNCGGKAGLCEQWCGAMQSCCEYGNLDDPPECRGVKFWPVFTHHICVTGSAAEAMKVVKNVSSEPSRADSQEAPIHRFYVYRAQSDAVYPFANVNAGNLDGVMWYLTNEVMPRCPKRYGIIRILRVIVTTRATPELFARGMNFGVRYSYDRGLCTGSNTINLGSCSLTWNRFGYVPGCNNFRDHYPWPKADTNYPEGIWYDLPKEGLCDSPTGAWNCTWSAEPAGEISIEEELERSVPGSNYCCHGGCTNFWVNPHSTSECSKRVQQVRKVFKQKYPDLPLDLPAPTCDFDRSPFWANWRQGLK